MAALNVQLKLKEGGILKPVNVATSIYNVSGLLGAEDQKIISSLLPSWIVGGMKFIATKSGTATLEGLFNEIETWLEEKELSVSEPYDEFRGKYFVVGGSGLTLTKNPQGIYDWSYSDDGGDPDSDEITLEPGDWVVYSHYVSGGGSGEIGTHFFGFVNNTYSDARENEAGVIKLATQDDALTGTNNNKAMTPERTMQAINNKLANYYVKSDVYTKSEVNSYLNNKQPLHSKLTELSELADGSGFVKQTSDGKFSIDNTTYATPQYVMSEISDHLSIFSADISASLNTKAPKKDPVFTGTITTPLGAGFVKSSSAGVLSVDNNIVTGIKGGSETDYRTGQVNITKSHIGLSNVSNYSIALESHVKANAASISDKYMTPQRTKEAIDYWAKIPIYSSEGEIPSDLPEGKLVFVEV